MIKAVWHLSSVFDIWSIVNTEYLKTDNLDSGRVWNAPDSPRLSANEKARAGGVVAESGRIMNYPGPFVCLTKAIWLAILGLTLDMRICNITVLLGKWVSHQASSLKVKTVVYSELFKCKIMYSKKHIHVHRPMTKGSARCTKK